MRELSDPSSVVGDSPGVSPFTASLTLSAMMLRRSPILRVAFSGGSVFSVIILYLNFPVVRYGIDTTVFHTHFHECSFTFVVTVTCLGDSVAYFSALIVYGVCHITRIPRMIRSCGVFMAMPSFGNCRKHA